MEKKIPELSSDIKFFLPDNRITSIFLVKLINNLNRDFANFIKRAEKEKIQLKDDRNQTSEAMNLNGIRRIKKN